MIGLELIPSNYQASVDQFIRGKISLASLHQKINYEEEWGFPWSHYTPILEWARYNRVRIIALNRPREIRSQFEELAKDLEKRDEWAAGIITDQIAATSAKIFVLYGELHVSRNHLPARLARISRGFLGRSLRSISIHQDLPWIYWKLAQKNRELSTHVVRLSRDSYALVSSPPWLKLQSLVNWAEGSMGAEETGDAGDAGDAGDTEDAEGGHIDWLSKFNFHVKTLCFFLDFPAPNSGSITLKTIEDPLHFDRSTRADFSRTERSLIEKHYRSNEKLFVPQSRTAYAGSPSENRLAELAADSIFFLKSGINWLYSTRDDDFYRLVLQAAFGFFGSLAFNPRRKCDLPQDHKKRVEFLRKNPRYRLFPEEIQARSLAVHFIERGKIPTCPPFGKMMAAKYIGQILGGEVYRAVMGEELTREDIRTIFLARFSASRENFYRTKYEALRALLNKTGRTSRASRTKHSGF
jgi:hypothetical protein